MLNHTVLKWNTIIIPFYSISDFITSFIIFFCRIQAEDYTQSFGSTNIGRRQYKLRAGLSPYAAYSFRVAAYNDLGLGEWSDPSPTYNTLPGPPDKAPMNIRGGGGRTGDLTVSTLH